MTLGDIVHKKHEEEKFNVEVEKEFIDLPSDPKPPIYKGQKVSHHFEKQFNTIIKKTTIKTT